MWIASCIWEGEDYFSPFQIRIEICTMDAGKVSLAISLSCDCHPISQGLFVIIYRSHVSLLHLVIFISVIAS